MGMVSENEYPDFVTDANRHAWDAMSSELQQQYLEAVPYILETYPDEKLSMALIGTVLAFGG